MRVFFYLEDRERTLDSPDRQDHAVADGVRRRARAREGAAADLRRDAAEGAGRATSPAGACFGYDNVDVAGADGERSHVERRDQRAEAAVVRRIFELCADGDGLTRIAKLLNAERRAGAAAAAGRPRPGRRSSVREVLLPAALPRRDRLEPDAEARPWGQHAPAARPAGEWLRCRRPSCGSSPTRCGGGARAADATARAIYLRTATAAGPADSGVESDVSAHRLRALCAVCGGSLAASQPEATASSARAFYGCTSYYEPRAGGLRERLAMRDGGSTREVLETLRDDVLRPAVVEDAIDVALEALPARARRPTTRRHARGANSPRSTARMRGSPRRSRQAAILRRSSRPLEGAQRASAAELERSPRCDATPAVTVDRARLERQVAASSADWRALLRRNVDEARAGAPAAARRTAAVHAGSTTDGAAAIAFEGTIALDDCCRSGRFATLMVASPTGFEPVFWP